MGKNTRQLIEEELDKTLKVFPIFKDESALTFDYIPETLPHRDSQILEMVRYFRGLFSYSESIVKFRQTLILIGPLGTGKTSTAKRFGLDLVKLAANKISSVNFLYRHINCRTYRTVNLVMVELLKTLLPYFPNRGFSSSELIREVLNTLEKFNLYLILTLDEIDYLFHDEEINTLLYTFSRINDDQIDTKNQRISLILITKNVDFVFLLDPSTKSSLAKNTIEFSAYNYEQLYDILTDRACVAFHKDVISSTVIQFITEATIDKGSDTRLGIELLWRSGKIAENEGFSIISPEHVRLALNSVNPINKELLQELSIHHKILLLSLAKILNRNPLLLRTSFSQLQTQYQRELRKYKLKNTKRTCNIVPTLQSLSNMGLITTIFKDRGQVNGKNSIEIGTQIPSESLIKEMDLLLTEEMNFGIG